MRIKILYEDSDILAINKPSGVLVHPVPEHPSSRTKFTTGQKARYGAGPDKQKTIRDIFAKKYPKLEIVHRLDKETSGVLLLAKNKKAHEFLKKQFQGREVKKVYNVIVSGRVKNDHGIINKPIGRSPKDFRRYLSGRGARGTMRDAETSYKVLKRLKDFTFLEVRPKTGRTHQIRVHMKFLNHPVVCDSLYSPGKPCPKGIKRLALHAKSIEFKNLKGQIVKVESPLPLEFKKVIK